MSPPSSPDDATVRDYHGSGAVPVVLIVGGVALVGCGALVPWGVRRNRRGRADTPSRPAG